MTYLPDTTQRRGHPAFGQNLGLGACRVAGARSMPLQQFIQAINDVRLHSRSTYDERGLTWAIALRRTLGLGGIKVMGHEGRIVVVLRGQGFWQGEALTSRQLSRVLGYPTARLHPLASEHEVMNHPALRGCVLNQRHIRDLSRRIEERLRRVTEDQQQRQTGEES